VKVKEHPDGKISSRYFHVPMSWPQPHVMLKEPCIHHQEPDKSC